MFKLIQDLLAPVPRAKDSKEKSKNQFQLLIERLPSEHKARWFAGSALNTAEQAMQSVLSTAPSRLNAFLDSELEQILCFDTAIDAEKFCNTKNAIFLVMPEEDSTKHFLISLIVQQLYREILAVADETGGKLNNRVMMFLDEIGTIPKIESAEMMFSASRSRRYSIIAIIQSFAQLEKNCGRECSATAPRRGIRRCRVVRRCRMGYFTSLYSEDLPHWAVSVYMYLKDRADKDGKCYPAIGTIAGDLKLSLSTVKRAIADLVEKGYLRKEQRWRENGGKSSLLFYVR